MHLAKISDIHVLPDRQRKTLDGEALEDLMRGIADKCLLHPITCRIVKGKLVLVSGERRLSALSRLAAEGKHYKCDGAKVAPGLVPYTLATELNDLQHKELELEENLLREDLTWQDRVVAIFELDELRREQNPNQTLGETAMEVGRSGKRNTRIEREILEARVIVPHLDDPAVRGARNRREAFNIACRLDHAALARELAVNLPENRHTLRLGDMARVLPELPSGEFDCIIADPPYGLNSNGAFGDAAKLRHDYEDSLVD
jgi:hypothetical protein